MLVTTPLPVTVARAVALLFVPATLLIVTVGAPVYPLPGSVMVMPVIAPLAPTVA
jgi:hypothetical protein